MILIISISYDINHFNIDNRNENKLIHLSGEVTTNGILTDNLFDVTAANMIKLKRVVEMYQWEESVYGYIYSPRYGQNRLLIQGSFKNLQNIIIRLCK